MVVDAYGGIWIVDPLLFAGLLVGVVASFLVVHAGLASATGHLAGAGRGAAGLGRAARRFGSSGRRRRWQPGRLRPTVEPVLPCARQAALLPGGWRELAQAGLAPPARRASMVAGGHARQGSQVGGVLP